MHKLFAISIALVYKLESTGLALEEGTQMSGAGASEVVITQGAQVQE